MDRYAARINLHGTTQRERILNRLKTDLHTKLPDNLSYKDVKVNGIETKLIINTSTKPYYKEFETLPNQFIQIGDYVEWSNRVWLVYEADSDDEVYIDGKMYECNYLLYWQNDVGDIISKWAFIQNASSYNNGEEEGKIITLASNQFMVWMPLDEDTINIRNGKRMFIDNYEEHPNCYELTRPDTVSMKFGNKGCTYYIFTQTETNLDTDKKITLPNGTQTWICDYDPHIVKPNTLPPINSDDALIPPVNQTPSITTLPLTTIKGSKILKCGYPRTYTVEFMDENDNAVDWNEIDFSWSVVADFDIEQDVDGNKLTLFVDDEDLIGSDFVVQIIVDDVMSEITIHIQDIV